MTHADLVASGLHECADDCNQRNEAAERLRVHWMIGSSQVRCGFPMRTQRHPEGWDLGTASASLTQVTCPKCLGRKEGQR